MTGRKTTGITILLSEEGLHNYSQRSSTKQKFFFTSPAQNTVFENASEKGEGGFLRSHMFNNGPNCRFVNELELTLDVSSQQGW